MSQLGRESLGGVAVSGVPFDVGSLPVAPESVSDSLIVSDTLQAVNTLTATPIEVLSIGFVSEESKYVALDLASTMNFTDQIDSRVIAVLIDQIFADGSFSYSWEGISALADEIGMNDLLGIFFSDIIEESISVSDLWSHYGLVLALSDAIRVTGVVSNILETRDILADAFALSDLIDKVMAGELTDAAQFTDVFQTTLETVAAVLDEMLLGDTLEFSLTVTALVEEQVNLVDSTDTIGELLSALEDGIFIDVFLTTDAGVYDAWIMNTMTTGVSRYDNQAFNSFALHTNRKYLGAMEDGVYELEGSTDDGTPISGLIKSGLMDFGSTLNKRIKDAWFAMATDGQMLLKMTTTDGEGQGKVERWYRVVETPNMYRARMAKGVRAKYWQFQLENIDGADFDVDSIVLHAIPLSRRH